MDFTKRLSAAFFILLIFIPLSIVHGQSETEHSLKAGSSALQFRIADNFNLTSFKGSAISYKWQLSAERARRLGLSFQNSYSWSDFPDSDNERETSGLGLNLAISYTWMNYINPQKDIKFYYGYGPEAILGYDKREEDETGTKNVTTAARYGLAGLAYAGVEWFFQPSMSLHVEYGASLRVNYRREKNITELNGNESTNEINRTNLSLGGNGVTFGLSMYF